MGRRKKGSPAPKRRTKSSKRACARIRAALSDEFSAVRSYDSLQKSLHGVERQLVKGIRSQERKHGKVLDRIYYQAGCNP